jgi:F-type H+-transporting ATPase subunit b
MDSLIHAFGLDWRIVLAQIINFGIVLGFIWFVAYKPLVAFLEKRQTLIREGVEQAERAHLLEKDAKEAAQATITSAEHEAAHITSSAHALAKKTHETAVKDAETRRIALLKDAEEAARAQTARIEAEAQDRVLKEAALLAEKVIKQSHG